VDVDFLKKCLRSHDSGKRRGRWWARWIVFAWFRGARGALDVGGGVPLGEDLGVAAEFVGDGGVEGFDEGAGLDDC
jgi:hypothetical protein